MEVNNRKNFIINFIYFAIVFLISYFVIKNLFTTLFPFLLGFLIAVILKPTINFLNKKLKISNTFISAIILLLFYSIIGLSLFFIFVKLFSLLKSLIEDLPNIFMRDVLPLIDSLTEWAKQLVLKINPDIIDFAQQFDKNIIDQLVNIVKNFSTSSLSLLTSFATKLPSFLVGFLFTIVSSVFITIDFEKITKFLDLQISDKHRPIFDSIRHNIVAVFGNLIKAYGILMSVTFVEAAIGLTLMKRNNAIGIALIIALVDIFPVLGTGTVVIPWAIIEFFNNNISDGIGLLALYFVITVVRQVLEPRVVGDSIGLYPLVTLISMFIGVKYFGAVGLFGLPMIVTIITKLHKEGIIKLYNDMEIEVADD